MSDEISKGTAVALDQGKQAGSEIDWTCVVPPQRAKAILQENPMISVLPKQTVELIAAVSGFFLRDIICESQSKRPGAVVDGDMVRQVLEQQPKYSVLSQALQQVNDAALQSSSHLTGKTRRRKTGPSMDDAKKSRKNGKRPKLSANDAALAQVAQDLLAHDGVGQADNLSAEIDVDDEEYD